MEPERTNAIGLGDRFRSIVFENFDDLRQLIVNINSFISENGYGSTSSSQSQDPLIEEEKEIIVKIYNYYKEGDEDEGYFLNRGEILKEIATDYLHILQNLLPSDKIIHMFRYLINLEWMEHRIKPEKKTFRDHILHPINVCLIGEELIFGEHKFTFYDEIKNSLEQILPGSCQEELTTDDDWENFIRLTWYITSLVHDFAYPIEIVHNKFTGKNNLYDVTKNHFSLEGLQEYQKANLSSSNFFLFENLLEKTNNICPINYNIPHDNKLHAILGSLELLHFFNENNNLGNNNRLFKFIIQLVSFAVFEHHKNTGFSFSLNPLGYMLTLADSIHEWGRYLNIGTPQKPRFICPIQKVIFENTDNYDFLIRYVPHEIMPVNRTWAKEKFKEGKEKEFKRFKPGEPFSFDFELK